MVSMGKQYRFYNFMQMRKEKLYFQLISSIKIQHPHVLKTVNLMHLRPARIVWDT
jgi:hypothetical protein